MHNLGENSNHSLCLNTTGDNLFCTRKHAECTGDGSMLREEILQLDNYFEHVKKKAPITEENSACG
jgi:hypothetical protein